MNLIPQSIRECALFEAVEASGLSEMLACLGARKGSFKKGEFVFLAEEPVEAVGVVITGGVHIIQEDFWGNRTILSSAGPGELFGEAFSCAGLERLPVSVVAAGPSEILLLNYRKIISTCKNSCAHHAALIHNMLRILARKNILLTQKMEILSMRSTKEKLLAYLSRLAVAQKSNQVEIPFSRQELADYLGVDRSALSRELGKLREDGILRFEKNKFALLRGL